MLGSGATLPGCFGKRQIGILNDHCATNRGMSQHSALCSSKYFDLIHVPESEGRAIAKESRLKLILIKHTHPLKTHAVIVKVKYLINYTRPC